ncbi:MAG: hypothetical protein R3A46_15060 [Thermomicrobiales bacterium]
MRPAVSDRPPEPLFRTFRTGTGTDDDLERRLRWDEVITHAGYDGPPRPRLLKKAGISTVLFPDTVWDAAAARRKP